MDHSVLFTATDICKAFGPTVALDHVDITIRRGEIHGLIGENGSGKSTLASIFAGIQQPDSGRMSFQSKTHAPQDAVAGQAAGVSMILQETGTISNLTVAQNVFLGRESLFTKFGLVQRGRMIQAAQDKLDAFGIKNVHARDLVNRYSFEERKLMEVIRGVEAQTEMLIIDETTTALSHDGREMLYTLMRDMTAAGKAVIFISHDLDELLEMCTVLTILRDGVVVSQLSKAEMKPAKVRQMMVGREIGDKYYRQDYDPSTGPEEVLSLEGIHCGPLADFSLTLHKGEILGLGGLSGSGMHQVGRIAFGIDKPVRGRVMCGATPVKDARAAIGMKMGYISKNRDTEALILTGGVKDNLLLPSLPYIEKKGFISPQKEKATARREMESLRIKASHMNQPVSQLSGGNKQKVSFGKWTAMQSDILIMDCPTRGVDIGVKQAMYQLIEDMKHEGKSILLISEELSELIGMCDRIAIMKDFAVNKVFHRSETLTDGDIIEYMI